MDIPKGDLKLMTEIGFSTTLRGLGVDATPIFKAVAAERPDNSAGAIGQALQKLVARDFDGAIALLRERGVTAKTGRDEAYSILSLALKLAGRESEAKQVAREIASETSHAAKFAELVTADPPKDTSPMAAPVAEPAAAGGSNG